MSSNSDAARSVFEIAERYECTIIAQRPVRVRVVRNHQRPLHIYCSDAGAAGSSMVQAMFQRISREAVTRSYYDDMSLALILFRFLWPFWLLQDASCGDRIARAAAYRHNRDMRIYLPGYLVKWLVSCTATLGMTVGLGELAQHSGHELTVLNLLAAGFGMAFACGVCVWMVTAYIYVFLSRHEN